MPMNTMVSQKRMLQVYLDFVHNRRDNADANPASERRGSYLEDLKDLYLEVKARTS